MKKFSAFLIEAEKSQAAKAAKKEPVLVYKFDRQPIRVVMRLEHLLKDGTEHGLKVELDWDAFG